MGKLRRHARQSTVLGLLGGAAMLAVMIGAVPEHIRDFIDIPGLIVVIGGTLTATLICRPVADVKRVLRRIPYLLQDAPPSALPDMNHLLNIAEHYRHGNLRAAEDELAHIGHPFLHSGVQLVLDRSPLPDLIKVLQWRIEAVRQAEANDAHILRTMAAFAPAFGMLGTLFGLVHMLHELGGSNLSGIGAAMGFALMTTLYGIVLANMFLKPLAMKMERRAQQMLAEMSVLQEGVLMLYERQHPMLIKETIAAFLTQHQSVLDHGRKSQLMNAA